MIDFFFRLKRYGRWWGVWLAAAATGIAVAGPAAAGVSVWTSLGPQGGPVRTFAIDPATPTTLYAGTTGGGVFKSTNAGTRWTAVNNGLTRTDVNVLMIDPTNSSTLYAGTEDGGVFKTTNGATSWTAINTGLTDPFVSALAIDPSAPSTLYAGTSVFGGVFKSTNGGANWAPVNTGLPADLDVVALAIDPIAPSTLYVGIDHDGVFKSIDAGANWAPASTGLTDLEITALAIDPTTPSTLYAGTGDGGVFKSTHAGTSWAPVNIGLTETSVVTLAIDPTAPSTLYVGTDDGVFNSVNAGANWVPANTGLTQDVDALVIDPNAPSTLYAGTFDGVSKSTNAGTSWTPLVNSDLTSTEIRSLVIDPTAPSTLYAGVCGGAGGLNKSTNGGVSWAAVTLWGPQALAIDPTAPSTLYAGVGVNVAKSTNGGTSWAPMSSGLIQSWVETLTIDPTAPNTIYAGTCCSDGPGTVSKSTNGGTSWALLDTGLTDRDVWALAIDPTAPSTLYAATGSNSGVYKSTDGGTSWAPTNSGLTNRDVRALVIDPTAPSTLYAGTSGGGVFKSSNGGTSWAPVDTGLTSTAISALVIDPTAPSTLYAGTIGGGVFMSTNAAVNWARVNPGLINTDQYGFIHSLLIAPTAPSTLYAATRGGGVFRLDQVDTIQESVPAGGRCSTDTEGASGVTDGATPADAIETTVYTPNAGLCGIVEQPAAGSPLAGYSLFGYEVTITAPPATSSAPLTLVFVIDASRVPIGQNLNTIRLLKDGALLGTCPNASGTAVPDPCIARRRRLTDGDIELTVLTSTASVWSPVVAALDSYLCYAAAATKGTAPGGPSAGHLLTDAFASTRFDFTKPGALCLAAARDGASIADGATALQTTPLKAGKVCSDTGVACRNKKECTAPATCDAQTKFATRKSVTVLNALGAIVVDATKPATVLLPSGTSASTPPGTPDPALDTFTCYTTKLHAKVCTGDPTRACESDAACGDAGPCFAAFPKDLTVRLEEPVATAGGKVFVVKKPTALCLPADFDNVPRKVPGVSLACYAIAPAKKQCANTATANAGASCKQEEDCGGTKDATSFCQAQTKHAPTIGVSVANDALGELRRDTKKEADVCVPSEVILR